jgi:hypothetical protein
MFSREITIPAFLFGDAPEDEIKKMLQEARRRMMLDVMGKVFEEHSDPNLNLRTTWVWHEVRSDTEREERISTALMRNGC